MSTHRTRVVDPWQRIGRTALQVAAAAVSLAPVYPAIRAAVTGPLAQVAATGWLITIAAIVAGLMSIPQVNALLAKVKLGAITPTVPQLDSETRAASLPWLQPAGVDATH